MDSLSNLFWESSVEEIKKGYCYQHDTEQYICLICGQVFEQGRIYSYDTLLLDAERAAKAHIGKEHDSMFSYLIGMNKRYTGLSDMQKEIFICLDQGSDDKEIARKLAINPSTVRNHRFKLREKEKQAKIFLAIMQTLEASAGKPQISDELVPVHREATMVDDRYVITQVEREKTLQTYLTDGRLARLPVKEKKKLIILQYIAETFATGKNYTEKEINDIIRRIANDHVTVRRYLIEYGFMDRKRDGSAYWIKQ